MQDSDFDPAPVTAAEACAWAAYARYALLCIAALLAAVLAPDFQVTPSRGTMNAPNPSESTALVAASNGSFDLAQVDAASLMLGPMWDRIQAVGKMMARGAVTIPKHLQGNEADCCAVALQAFGWHMNPFAVAQKTHITKGGALGYEAQLVNAVIQASGALEGDPDYEYLGDWSKVLGKVKEMKSDNGGKYYVATYTQADEEGLGVVVKARLRGEAHPRELTVMMSQAWPRFSTQWATDPKQQISYLAMRKFVRLHKPGVLLGIYTNDEMEPAAGGEKFMGPADVVHPPAPPAASPAQPATYSDEGFKKNLPAWTALIVSGKKTADQVIATIETKAPLTEAQKTEIRKAKPAKPPQPAPAANDQAEDVTPKVTYAQVADAINAAQDHDQLKAAQELIASVGDEGQRAELTGVAERRAAELPF